MISARTVLVVDDEDHIRQIVRIQLQRRGYRVHVAHDRVSALFIAKQHAVDFAIVDQNLDNRIASLSGLELAKELLAEHESLRILIYTGYANVPAAFRAGRDRMIGYLQKPATIEQIVARLEGRTEETPPSAATLERVVYDHAARTVADCDGNISQAALDLDVERNTLRRILGRPAPRR